MKKVPLLRFSLDILSTLKLLSKTFAIDIGPANLSNQEAVRGALMSAVVSVSLKVFDPCRKANLANFCSMAQKAINLKMARFSP